MERICTLNVANSICRRVISFGVIKGLIYRVHKYPILTSTSESESFPSRDQYHRVINKYTGSTIHSDIIPFLDGKHHYDEICTELECSPQELDEQLGCPRQDGTVEETAVIESTNEAEEMSQWSVQFIFR